MPPKAISCWKYGMPTILSGNESVTMVRSLGLIVIDKGLVTETPWLSVTITVKPDVPEVVGMPVIDPLEGSSDSPSGREPALIDQV